MCQGSAQSSGLLSVCHPSLWHVPDMSHAQIKIRVFPLSALIGPGCAAPGVQVHEQAAGRDLSPETLTLLAAFTVLTLVPREPMVSAALCHETVNTAEAPYPLWDHRRLLTPQGPQGRPECPWKWLPRMFLQ